MTKEVDGRTEEDRLTFRGECRFCGFWEDVGYGRIAYVPCSQPDCPSQTEAISKTI